MQAQAERVEEADLGTPDARPTRGRWRSRSGADKREAWERLLRETEAGRARAAPQPAQHARGRSGARSSCFRRLRSMSTARVLPFRFLAAARYAPQWEEALEQAMLKCVAGRGEAAGQDHRTGGRLRLDDRAAVSPFGDAAHRRSLRSGCVAARDRARRWRCTASLTIWSRCRRVVASLCAMPSTLRSATTARSLGKAVEKLNRNEKLRPPDRDHRRAGARHRARRPAARAT